MSVVPLPVQAFESPSRAGEAAVAAWLIAPDIVALMRSIPTLPSRLAARVGATLDVAVLFKLTPSSDALTAAIAALAKQSEMDPFALTVQRCWGLQQLPFELSRLRQRMQEQAAAVTIP